MTQVRSLAFDGIFRGGGSTRKEVLTDKRGESDKEMPIDIPAADGPIIPR